MYVNNVNSFVNKYVNNVHLVHLRNSKCSGDCCLLNIMSSEPTT